MVVVRTVAALGLLLASGGGASATAWTVYRTPGDPGRAPAYEAFTSDPATGARLMFRCAQGRPTVYVAMPDRSNWTYAPGTGAIAYVQVGSTPTATYQASVVVKRDSLVVYDLDADGLASRMADGEVRVMIPRNSENPMATFDTVGDADALAPVMACGR